MTKERRTYKPRIVGDKVMMPADRKRLHNYMLDVQHIDITPTRCARWPKSYGPSWRTSCRRGDRHPMGGSCRTFREEPLARSVSYPSGALI
jgi:hypothetical protein